MSEPTYRVDLLHRPQHETTSATGYPWRATLVRLADDQEIEVFWGDTADSALAHAQVFAEALATRPQTAGPMYLTKDGEIVDRLSVLDEVQR